MKRISAIFLTLAMFVVLAMQSIAIQERQTYPIVYYLEEQVIKDAFIDKNGRTQVNIDAFAKTFGLEYELIYAYITGTDGITVGYPTAVTINDFPYVEVESPHKNTILSFAEGEYQMILGDEVIVMDTTAAFTKDGIYVPLRYAAEALGYAVAWDSESKSVYIDKPLPSEARHEVDKLIVRHWYFGQVITQFTMDFQSCQFTMNGYEWLIYDEYYSALYMPSDKHEAFFDAVELYGFLNWNNLNWIWHNTWDDNLSELPPSDGIQYDISVIFDDGMEWEKYGYESFPDNWNQMREAFIELTGTNVLLYEGRDK